MNAFVRPSTEADVAEMLHYGLRDADRLECEAAGFDEGFALQESFKVTPDCRTVVYNNEPVGMFGVAPVPSSGVRVGLVWFLGTNGMSKITTRFLRESRQWLETISADYDLLTNIVHHGNTLHIRWLQWLGFVFLSRRAGPFIEFVRITDVQHPSDRVEIQRGHPE